MVYGDVPRGLCFVTRGCRVELLCICLFFVVGHGVVVELVVVDSGLGHVVDLVRLMVLRQMYVSEVSPGGESDGVCGEACLRGVAAEDKNLRRQDCCKKIINVAFELRGDVF